MARKSARRYRDPLTRLADNLLGKLLKAPQRARYEAVLTAEELNEAVLMIRAAVAHARAKLDTKRIPPRTFPWRGRNYSLRYSNAGRVFISTKDGVLLIGSDYFAL